MQVVFQITSGAPDASKALLGQLNNLLQYFSSRETRIAVEVVVHGDAWPLLLSHENPYTEKIMSLVAREVKWLICQNTLNSHQLDATQLFAFTAVVPAAVAHLVERQAAGWAYIKC
ncbi:DsrE family protein [Chitinophaga nivalis]|uniref:DsrE family protein n=1 Tax=Chitinophaga nivalis TaxID=2991709 RepID=A0ABT3IIQ9_9BACT|nr:DsrE family protein [Chitinophaga nivalis]MCW3466468.1 DsrE family protein [Chitinophaga nivalis]MCW3483841.1 DsrE family protein [Chitinophaga nivalis]